MLTGNGAPMGILEDLWVEFEIFITKVSIATASVIDFIAVLSRILTAYRILRR